MVGPLCGEPGARGWDGAYGGYVSRWRGGKACGQVLAGGDSCQRGRSQGALVAGVWGAWRASQEVTSQGDDLDLGVCSLRLKSVNWWGECSEKSRASPARLCHLLGSVSVSCCCVRTRHADSVMGWDGLSAGRWGGLSWADSRVNGVSSGPLTADTGLPHLARRAGQGLFSHGPAARGSRGTGRPLEGASLQIQVLLPHPLAKAAHMAMPKVKRWEAHCTHCGAVAGMWVQAGTEP